MTKMYFLVDDATGRCLQIFNALNIEEAGTVCIAGQTAMQAPEGVLNTGVYFSAGAFHPIPEQRSTIHTFNWQTKQWEDPRTLQDHINETRRLRNSLLLACDWTQLPDVPQATQLAWAAYRQVLRDVTDQPDQMNVVWPVKPI